MPVTLRSSSASVQSLGRGQVQVGEEHLPLAHPVVLLGSIGSLTLRIRSPVSQTSSAVGRMLRAGGDELVVGDRRARRRRPPRRTTSCPWRDELVHAGRRDRDAVLVVLDLAGDADLHGYPRPSSSSPTPASAQPTLVLTGSARQERGVSRSCKTGRAKRRQDGRMSHHYPTLTPHLGVKDGAAAIDFYAKAFGATEETRFQTSDGTRDPRGDPARRRAGHPGHGDSRLRPGRARPRTSRCT